jgi:hypothetical protein
VGGSIDWSVSAVSAWLDRPLLQLDSGRRATFVRWDARRGDVYGAPAFGAMWAHAGGRRAVLLLSWPWSEPPGPEPEPVVRVDEALGYRAVRVARFGGAVVHDESYDVYVLSALGSEAASVP